MWFSQSENAITCRQRRQIQSNLHTVPVHTQQRCWQRSCCECHTCLVQPPRSTTHQTSALERSFNNSTFEHTFQKALFTPCSHHTGILDVCVMLKRAYDAENEILPGGFRAALWRSHVKAAGFTCLFESHADFLAPKKQITKKKQSSSVGSVGRTFTHSGCTIFFIPFCPPSPLTHAPCYFLPSRSGALIASSYPHQPLASI